MEASARPKDVVAAPAPRISKLRRSSNERTKGERRASGSPRHSGAKKFGAKGAAPKTPLGDRSNRPAARQAWAPKTPSGLSLTQTTPLVAPSPMRDYSAGAGDYF